MRDFAVETSIGKVISLLPILLTMLFCAASSVIASAWLTRTNRIVSPALSCPIFHSSACTMAAGQTKPPKLGPSGPNIIGISPVKSIEPMA